MFPASVVFAPKLYSWHRMGGPEMAEVAVTGPVDYLWSCVHLIGKSITIYNQHGQPVWWGLVTEIEMQMDNINLSLNLAEMANKVKALYVADNDAGVPEDGATAWAQNDNSVTQFGPYEETITLDETELATAEQARDGHLAVRQYPVAALAIAPSSDVTVYMRGDGYYSLLSKEYYANDDGLTEHTDGSAEQAVGVAQTSTLIGVLADSRILTDVGPGFQTGNKVIISGSVSNDGTHTIESHVEQEDFTESSSATIYFEAADDIKDTAPNIEVDEGDVIMINGSASNSGIWSIERERNTDIWFEVDNSERDIVTEAASSVTIRRRSYATLTGDPSLTDEYTGASITATAYGQEVDQSFQTGTTGNWVMTAIAIKCKKTGTPADSLRVRLYDDAGPLLDTATLTEADISETFEWTEFAFSGAVELDTSTVYHIRVNRTGSSDDENFYSVIVDEELGYTGGSLLVWTGAAWVTREPSDADLAFRVIGRVDSTEQMEAIVAASSHLSGFIAEKDSGLDTMLYKEGVNKASDDFEALLNAGTTSDEPWICVVHQDKSVRVWERDLPDETSDLYIAGDGRLYEGNQTWTDGRLPVGRWIRIRDLPPIAFGIFTSISPAFIERAEYTVESGEYKLEPLGAPSVFEIADIRNR